MPEVIARCSRQEVKSWKQITSQYVLVRSTKVKDSWDSKFLMVSHYVDAMTPAYPTLFHLELYHLGFTGSLTFED